MDRPGRPGRKFRPTRTQIWTLNMLFLFFSVCLLFQAARNVAVYFQLQNQIAQNEMRLEQTMALEEELQTTKKNLTNLDYLEFIARGRYRVTKDEEQVFVFPELAMDKEPEEEQTSVPQTVFDQVHNAQIPADTGDPGLNF